MKITNKQLIVLDYIKQYIAEKGYSPTVREICTGLGLRSPATIQEHLKKLALAGLIVNDPRKSRTIELLVENEYLKEDSNIYMLPIYSDNNINLDFLPIPKFMIGNYNKKSLFVFKDIKNYYVINKNLTPFTDSFVFCKDKKIKPSKGVKDDEILGVVISEIKVHI